MRKIALVLSVVGAGVFAAAAQAHEDGKGRGHWDRLDVNGDGKITADEMDAQQAEFLAGADADGDGAITREEMIAYHKARRAEHRGKRMGDANGDGVVERGEYMDAAGARFDKLDKNGDGKLTEDEMPSGKGRGHHRRGEGKK